MRLATACASDAKLETGSAPMNRVVHVHLWSIMPGDPRSDGPVFLGGGARPNARFQRLCELAGIKPRANVETGEDELWELKDLRKTCATYYDEHVPESSVEILGHSVGGITYRHYAHRAPLAFRAILTLPQIRAMVDEMLVAEARWLPTFAKTPGAPVG